MKILVPVKRVVDANVRVRVSANNSIDTMGLKMSINPFDECALECALRLRDAGVASSVTAVTVGEPITQDVLRTALAMGADDAVLLKTNGVVPDALAIAKVIASYIQNASSNDDYRLVLCGKQAIDDDIGGVAAMLAGLLDWPQALNVSTMQVTSDGWSVDCGDDSGLSRWNLKGAAVISADLRLAEPRRVTLPNIVKAKQKPLATIDLSTFGLSLEPKVRTLLLAEPAARTPGIRLADIPSLLTALGHERLFQPSGALS